MLGGGIVCLPVAPRWPYDGVALGICPVAFRSRKSFRPCVRRSRWIVPWPARSRPHGQRGEGEILLTHHLIPVLRGGNGPVRDRLKIAVLSLRKRRQQQCECRNSTKNPSG